MLGIVLSRPSSGLQPATLRWRAFVRRPSGRLCISTKHSATAARRSSFLFAPRPRSRLGTLARLRRSGGRRRLALASPGFTHARGTGETPQRSCRLSGSQPLLAIARDSLCLPLVVPYRIRQGLLQTNIAAISLGVNRPGCVPCQTGSRLFFYRYPVAAMSSSHRLTAARFRSLPGGTRLGSGFCQYAGPSDNRTVMQSSRALSTLCVYSPLRFAYGYITQTIIRRASRWRQLPTGSPCGIASVGSGHGRPLQSWLAAV